VCQTVVVQDAWKRGQRLTVHGWVYGLKDGLIRDLGINVSRREDLMQRYFAALEALEA
ncbi:MAG: carbonate dehydratase, partial [Zoogloea sp.]|nr:carbonate dehydratase [Zoogloea sp.]